MGWMPEHIKSFFLFIKNKFSEWKWGSVILPILLFTIIGCFSFYYKNGESWYNKLAYLGFWLSGLVIGSGCFAAFIKTFLYKGIMKEVFMGKDFEEKLDEVIKKEFRLTLLSDEYNTNLIQTINKIIYESKYLQKDKNLENIWREVTTCFIQDEFPEIKDKLLNKIQNVYFRHTSLSYYLKDRTDKYKVNLINDKYIDLLINSQYTIKRKSIEEFLFEIKYCVEKDRYDEMESLIDIKEVKIDDKSLEINEYLSSINKIVGESSEKNIFKNLEIPLNGSLNYDFEITTLLRYPYIDEFDFFGVTYKRIIDGLKVEIFCEKKIEHNFSEFGLEKFIRNSKNAFNSGTTYKSNGLILPEQGGYRINFKLLNKETMGGGEVLG